MLLNWCPHTESNCEPRITKPMLCHLTIRAMAGVVGFEPTSVSVNSRVHSPRLLYPKKTLPSVSRLDKSSGRDPSFLLTRQQEQFRNWHRLRLRLVASSTGNPQSFMSAKLTDATFTLPQSSSSFRLSVESRSAPSETHHLVLTYGVGLSPATVVVCFWWSCGDLNPSPSNLSVESYDHLYWWVVLDSNQRPID